MASPSTWRDTIQAKAHELEEEGMVGPCPEGRLHRSIDLVHVRIYPYLYAKAGAKFFRSLPIHPKHQAPIVPGGIYNVLAVLRLAVSSYLLARPIRSWYEAGAPSWGEIRALTIFFEQAPNRDLVELLTMLCEANTTDDDDTETLLVSPKYEANWRTFWKAVVAFENAPQPVADNAPAVSNVVV